MIRVRRVYRRVTRRGRKFYVNYNRRKVRFTFGRSRYFKYRGRRLIVRRVGRGRKYLKFRFKGRWSKRRIRYRKRKRLRRK